jgi:hypothetical protein
VSAAYCVGPIRNGETEPGGSVRIHDRLHKARSSRSCLAVQPVGAGEGAKIGIERPVFLIDHENVLDVLLNQAHQVLRADHGIWPEQVPAQTCLVRRLPVSFEEVRPGGVLRGNSDFLLSQSQAEWLQDQQHGNPNWQHS